MRCEGVRCEGVSLSEVRGSEGEVRDLGLMRSGRLWDCGDCGLGIVVRGLGCGLLTIDGVRVGMCGDVWGCIAWFTA